MFVNRPTATVPHPLTEAVSERCVDGGYAP
jgi:hypothetical protein